jgi:hypothetical protein
MVAFGSVKDSHPVHYRVPVACLYPLPEFVSIDTRRGTRIHLSKPAQDFLVPRAAADEIRAKMVTVPNYCQVLSLTARKRAARLCGMRRTIEAEVDENGNIRTMEPVALPPGSRVLVTLLETEGSETASLSEAALAVDWERPEEEAAWSHLNQG